MFILFYSKFIFYVYTAYKPIERYVLDIFIFYIILITEIFFYGYII